MSPTAKSVFRPPAAFVTEEKHQISHSSPATISFITNDNLDPEQLQDSNWECYILDCVTFIETVNERL